MNLVTVNVSFANIAVRCFSDVANLPWNCQQQKWVILELGENVRKVEVKTQQNENKHQEICAYPSVNAWRKLEVYDSEQPLTVDLSHLLESIRNKTRGGSREEEVKTVKGRDIKKRITVRSNTYSYKPTLLSMRGKESTGSAGDKNKEGGSLPRFRKLESVTFKSIVVDEDEGVKFSRRSTA
jgi:hypothetical protein